MIKLLNAVIKLYWSSASQSKEIIPASAFFNVYDECPEDPNKIFKGECGCGVEEGTCEVAKDHLLMITFGEHTDTSYLYIFPNGKTMMIDSARDFVMEDRIIPILKHYGINHLDYFQASHSHGDHTGGIPALKRAGLINDRTKMEVCTDFKVGERFEREGTSWYIYNASHGGSCENPDSIAYIMEYNNFRFSGGGDEYLVGKKSILKNDNLEQFFPVDVRCQNHHCGGPWHPPFEEMLNAQVYLCPKINESTTQMMESGSRFWKIVRQDKIHIIKVKSSEDWTDYECESKENCKIDIPPRS